MIKLRSMAIFFFMALSYNYAYSQLKNTNKQTLPANNNGAVKGILRDTVNNYTLKSASVSIYKAADSTLISYQASNNYGAFNFINLPVGIQLRLDISHVGHAFTQRKFTILPPTNSIDLGTMIIKPEDINLDEVKVTVPPITMNGDTLEFNAGAFKLDSNARVEDLLKKIPEITIWDDGTMTVNGREVKNIRVNGQSFFTGDLRIALQNIPKNALEKVQVYRTINKENPLDSTLNVNLKLKKGKDIGYFGKIGIGYGSGERYESDANMNFFNPKMKLAIVGASNNINKNASSVLDLMLNSTFKGTGTNIDYQSNFRSLGITRGNSTGFNYNYNFSGKPDSFNQKSLSVNYFLQNKKIDNSSDIKSTTIINSNNSIINTNNASQINESTNQNLGLSYQWSENNKSFFIKPSFNREYGENNNSSQQSSTNALGELISANNVTNTGNFAKNNFNLNTNIKYPLDNTRAKTIFRGLNIDYKLAVIDNQSNYLSLIEFISYNTPSSNKDYNRKTSKNLATIDQVIVADLPGIGIPFLQKLGISTSLSNQLKLRNDRDNSVVEDLSSATNTYQNNSYLSNQLQTNNLEELAELKISKSFNESLTNRFSKSLIISFNPKQQFSTQKSSSNKSFQNTNSRYTLFIPDASIGYSNNQYGESINRMNLSFNTTMSIPTIYQLAPLVDSSNVYSIVKGNSNLKQAISRSINFNFSHDDQKNKNTLNYGFGGRIEKIDNNIVDSLSIDNQNRRTIYFINADGYKYLGLNGNIRKVQKFKNGELQATLRTSISTTKYPGYINGVYLFYKNFNSNTTLDVNFSYKTYLSFNLSQSLNTYHSKQEAFNSIYSGNGKTTAFASSLNLTKRFTVNSNLNFNSNTTTNSKNINYTIWNASAVYRMLKGNNAEMKFSALDILHQNTSVINENIGNGFRVGSQKVLQQYFMFTLSYYPNQFGKSK
jgi:hypothetical protein